jgi:hypothetical protein
MSETKEAKTEMPESYKKLNRDLRAFREGIVNNNVRVFSTGVSGQTFTKNRTPAIINDAEDRGDKVDEYNEDPEINRLRSIMLIRSPQNLRWCSDNDNAVGTSKVILSKSIMGSSGLEPKTKNEDDKEWIEDYLKLIKYDEIIEHAIDDNVPHADNIHWKEYKPGIGIIPQWIEYLTLHPVKNPYTAKTKWFQITYVDQNMPKTDRGWLSYAPQIDWFHDTPRFSENPKTKFYQAQMLEEDVFRIKLFIKPPIKTIVEVIIWKKYMQHDALLGGQKYATPLMDIEVDLPDTDLNSDETWTLMDRICGDINTMMNFGSIAHPSSVRITPVQQNGQVFNFTTYLEYADKQIHKTILVPTALVDSKGTEMATGKTVDDRFSVNINAMRKKLSILFEELVKENAEFVGRKLDPFTLEFSEEDKQQRLTHFEEISVIKDLYTMGIMKDENEVRAYLSKFDIELEQLSTSELGTLPPISDNDSPKGDVDEGERKTSSGKLTSTKNYTRTPKTGDVNSK